MRKPRVLFLSEASYLSTGYATYSREVLKRLYASNKYEIAEFSIYSHWKDERRKNVPWKTYCNMPAPDETDLLEKYRQSPTNQFGAWRFERACIDFKPNVVCFPKKTHINTVLGIKNIEDIKVGDLVLTHKGRYKRVIKTFCREYTGNTITIQTSNCAVPVEMTEKHPVLCFSRQTASFPKNLDISRFSWTDAKDIKHKDILAFPVGSTGSVDMDKALCMIIGYYVSEGCIMYEGKKSKGLKKGVQFTFHRNEIEYARFIKTSVDRLYNAKTSIRIKNNTCIVRSYSPTMANDMFRLCGELSGKKTLSEKLMNLNRESLSYLLCAIFRGDGGFDSRRGYYCTKSIGLAFQIFQLSARIGIVWSFNNNKNSIKEKTFHRYMFSCSSTSLENLKTLCETPYKVLKNNQSKRLKDGYVFSTVKNIAIKNKKTEVYNFEVEDDNSYVTSFCVHNCDERDFWMSSFILSSILRPYYKVCWMPTVDAAPQNTEWLDLFGECDGLLTYSDWASDVLKKQAGLNTYGSAPASAQEEYRVLDKRECRRSLGIDPDTRIVGTVMRNQRRKLFPDLFKAFRKYLDKTGDTNTLLYCHTSYPDNGWPLAQLIVDHDIASRVLLTYHCEGCGHVFASYFSNPVRQCGNCGQFAAKSSSVNHGVDVETMSRIYNAMDLYVQCVSSEGLGIPWIEASACGIPVMATDYSAMESECRKIDAIMIPPIATYKELETGCERAVPDTDFIADKIEDVLSKPDAIRRNIGFLTRQKFEKAFSWDDAAQKWMTAIDDLSKTPAKLPWDSQCRSSPEIPADKIPDFPNNKQFLDWMFTNYLKMPEKIGTYHFNCLLRDLNNGMFKPNPGGFFYSDSSVYGRTEYRPLNREVVVKMLHGKLMEKNFWEDVRTGRVRLEKEPWL